MSEDLRELAKVQTLHDSALPVNVHVFQRPKTIGSANYRNNLRASHFDTSEVLASSQRRGIGTSTAGVGLIVMRSNRALDTEVHNHKKRGNKGVKYIVVETLIPSPALISHAAQTNHLSLERGDGVSRARTKMTSSILALLGLILATASAELSSRIVRTKYGELSGVIVTLDRHLEGVEVFRGVPYASPPVGSLRFMPPVSGALWHGVKVADKFGPVCPQRLPELSDKMPKGRVEYLRRLLPYLRNQSEDCLYLNIYAPVQDSDDEESASEDIDETIEELAIAEEEELNNDGDSLDNIQWNEFANKQQSFTFTGKSELLMELPSNIIAQPSMDTVGFHKRIIPIQWPGAANIGDREFKFNAIVCLETPDINLMKRRQFSFAQSNAIGGSGRGWVAFTAKAGIVIEQVATFPDNGWKIQELETNEAGEETPTMEIQTFKE
ncbi:Neuroligin-4, Y-linked [Melipona quadrifasciata]|uniref:Neuroligin-4, Y-linked n=1 Tax=Melipona quadrifasciata TaxID=166423 RepID=A0A0M9ACM0_9HYME|nr:Neuroligin-4, Y-linked [Melipona quadrifasciata]